MGRPVLSLKETDRSEDGFIGFSAPFIGVGGFRILRGPRFRILWWGGGGQGGGGQIPSRHMTS